MCIATIACFAPDTVKINLHVDESCLVDACFTKVPITGLSKRFVKEIQVKINKNSNVDKSGLAVACFAAEIQLG